MGKPLRGRLRFRRPESSRWTLDGHTQQLSLYGMKMTLHIDDRKVQEAMAEYGLKTKTEAIDFALAELLRQKAVERAIASFGKHPDLTTNAEIEKSEKRHTRDARRH
jgi:Arc/MetJ family transcription regulator